MVVHVHWSKRHEPGKYAWVRERPIRIHLHRNRVCLDPGFWCPTCHPQVNYPQFNPHHSAEHG